MGIFGTSSPFDADIERVTDEKNTTENWSLILDICDRASASPKEALRSIVRSLNDRNPHVQLQTVTLLDSCISNSGRQFQLEVCGREFESELRRLISAASTHSRVKARLLTSLQKWCDEELSSDPQLSLLPDLCRQLHADGTYDQLSVAVDHQRHPSSSSRAPAMTATTSSSASASNDPNVVQSQQEEDDIAKAIALSMKEAERTPSSSTPLYPSATAPASDTAKIPAHEKKARALYDFEAAEDNELTFKTGEIIIVLEDSDANWWLGSNHRGRGLFPSNFVTTELNHQPPASPSQRKSVQFSDSVHVRTVALDGDNADASDTNVTQNSGGGGGTVVNTQQQQQQQQQQVTVIEPRRIERLLTLLNEADPTGVRADSCELLALEDQCLMMAPLIDQQLERIDRRHAQLTAISRQLVDALNIYHQLMYESGAGGGVGGAAGGFYMAGAPGLPQHAPPTPPQPQFYAAPPPHHLQQHQEHQSINTAPLSLPADGAAYPAPNTFSTAPPMMAGGVSVAPAMMAGGVSVAPPMMAGGVDQYVLAAPSQMPPGMSPQYVGGSMGQVGVAGVPMWSPYPASHPPPQQQPAHIARTSGTADTVTGGVDNISLHQQ